MPWSKEFLLWCGGLRLQRQQLAWLRRYKLSPQPSAVGERISRCHSSGVGCSYSLDSTPVRQVQELLCATGTAI